MSDRNIDDIELEQLFTASMTEYVDRFEVPAFRVSRFRKPVWPRRVAMGIAMAALVGVAGSVALSGLGASPVTSGAPKGLSPWPATNPRAVAGPGGVIGALVFDAELYENPATRSQVDLNAVRSLFIDDSAFQHYWGSDALGVTCGKVADGAVETGDRVAYLHGVQSPIWDAIVTVDGASSTISGLTCVPRQPVEAGIMVMSYYGGLLDAFRMTDTAAEDNAIGDEEQVELTPPMHAAKDIFAASTCSTRHFHVWFGYGSTGDLATNETVHVVTDVAAPFTATSGPDGAGAIAIATVHCDTP
jgi:hypothetical protein